MGCSGRGGQGVVQHGMVRPGLFGSGKSVRGGLVSVRPVQVLLVRAWRSWNGGV